MQWREVEDANQQPWSEELMSNEHCHKSMTAPFTTYSRCMLYLILMLCGCRNMPLNSRVPQSIEQHDAVVGADGYIEIAYCGSVDVAAVTTTILAERGIVARSFGSVVYGIQVPNDRAKEAVLLLHHDSRLAGMAIYYEQ